MPLNYHCQKMLAIMLKAFTGLYFTKEQTDTKAYNQLVGPFCSWYATTNG